MPRDTIEVEFRPDGDKPCGGGGGELLWTAIGILATALAVVVIINLLPLLLPLLALAAVLAAFSTWKAGHRREVWRKHGWPVPAVGARTYVSYLAAWFFGLLAIVPLFFVLMGGFVLVLAAVGVIIIVSIVVGLFKLN